MSTIPTCAVRAIAQASVGGAAVVGAVIQAKLSSFEIYNGFVAPELVQATTGPDGTAVLHLFPNELGSASSFYEVKIVMPDGKTMRTTAVIPNLESVDLHDYSEVPVYEGKPESAVTISKILAFKEQTQSFRNEASDAATAAGAHSASADNAKTAAQMAREAAEEAAALAVDRLLGKVGKPDAFLSLFQFDPKGDGTDDLAAFSAWRDACRTRAQSGGICYAYLPRSPMPDGKWAIDGLLHFDFMNVYVYMDGGIKQISPLRTHTLLFAKDTNQQPASSLRSVVVFAKPGVEVDGNEQNMSFGYVPGDGSANTSAVHFNYIDGVYVYGLHATRGPIDSMSMRQCRNWLIDQCEFSFPGVSNPSFLGNGFSATTDWNAAGWSPTDPRTWGHGTARNCIAHDGCTSGMTAFNATGVWFDRCNSYNNFTGYTYEKQAFVAPTKGRVGGFRACGFANISGNGFLVDDCAVTIDDACYGDGTNAVVGDADKIFGNAVCVSTATEVYVGGRYKNIANAGLAIFNGIDSVMEITVSARFELCGSHGIYSRGASHLKVLDRTVIKTVGGSGIYANNSGAAGYNRGGTSTIDIGAARIEEAANSAIATNHIAFVNITNTKGRNNCTANSANAGIAINLLECLGHARVTGVDMPEDAGKQGYLIVAANTVTNFQEYGNIGGATVARVLNNALATMPFVLQATSLSGTAEVLRLQNPVSTSGASAELVMGVTPSPSFKPVSIAAVRTDATNVGPATNAHQIQLSTFDGNSLIRRATLDEGGLALGGVNKAKNTLDVGGTFGGSSEKVITGGAANPNMLTTNCDPTTASFSLTLMDAGAAIRQFRNFVFFGDSSNTVTISLGGGTFSDGTTFKVLSRTNRALRLHAYAADHCWSLL